MRTATSSSPLYPHVPKHQDKGGNVDEDTDNGDDGLGRQDHYPTLDSGLVLIVY